MAILRKSPVIETLNAYTGVGGEWSVSSALNISSQAAVELSINSNTSQICVYSDSDVVFRFDTATGDSTSAANDLIIAASTLTYLVVPRGLGATVFVHFKQVSSVTTKTLRIVEI